MKTAINIGASKEAVQAARAAILGILKTTAEERTKRQALSTLHGICGVSNSSISNCNFTMDGAK